ncbi:MAG TPA: gamma-glutamyltransferase [Candidatus Saccharimonadales bacterium]|nr:gamma-glutamyltransferase [Candidatus Saccharimonadales bacterium]
MARRGLVATSQPLASAAGLRVLMEGGNAVDAAVTAAAVLSVVEPSMNGIGGDLFAIVYDPATRTLRGLNASGRSAYAATAEALRARGCERVPEHGVLSISVPGVVDGWAQLLARCGTIPLSRALAPAIEYARHGFPVAEIVGVQWQEAERFLAADSHAARTFLPAGRAPRPGEIFANPRLAASLEQIAHDGPDAFYRGGLARAIVADLQQRGSLLDARDFAETRADWVEPLRATYRGYEVCEMPPNTQGLTAIEMLNILEADDLRALGHNSAACLHLLIEAKRIAFADRDAYIADPAFVPPHVIETLASKSYAAARRREIDPRRAAASHAPAALPVSPGEPGAPTIEGRDRGDTVYLTAADGQGHVISLIQSIFNSFGSGVVAGDTGIVLHNRGSLFSLQPGHPCVLGPHKRPMHTIIPAMVLRDGRPWLSFGVMGGDLQPQGHVQVLANLIDFGMNVQEAGEAARVRSLNAGVALESGIPPDVRAALAEMGHTLVDSPGGFGGFQGILIDPQTGVLMGGSDPRKDGEAVGW